MIDGSNLRRRLLFVLWAAPLGWWVINSPLSLTNLLAQILPASLKEITRSYTIIPAEVAIILVIMASAYEYGRMLRCTFNRNAFWLAFLWLFCELVFDLLDVALPLRYSLFILMTLVAFEAIVWGEKNTGRWKRASLLFSGTVFLYISGISLLNLYTESFSQFFKSFNNPLVAHIGMVSFIGSVVLCDTFAYFIGSTFGRHRYSNISPNKTIEGGIAGLIAAILTSTILWHYFGNQRYGALTGLLMGILAGIFAQAGDLIVSLIKRYFKTKDSSDLIPGHGGVLDRFGSLFFAAPVFGLMVWIINHITG